ncbi:sulfatase family protein [Pontiella agarivorans]|uniref:Sulfatase n=1 Tax=Pontiella agarivorans TaxID=3038953 RepID=A0ABU5MS40_9BACT|nr:sulfatase [Pontiella agarivorans]MDZ8117027.1 sulfatase [Pontiella agarivorans]
MNIRVAVKVLLISALLFAGGAPEAVPVERPNVILILADDMGYADIGCFGSTKNRTPVLDQMAEEGMRFTSFNTHAVCGPSRAAIMTGCYAMRVAETKNLKRHHPDIHRDEIMIPGLLKPAGYATAAIGKWDLNGHKKDYKSKVYPSDFGFDYSYGRLVGSKGRVYENGLVTKSIPYRASTEKYTDQALAFIENYASQPFFLYLAHAMPHEPVQPGVAFEGKSANGRYGDVIEELDWHIGRIMTRLKELNLDEKTVVIFCSDNGPWPYWTGPEDSGETGPLRGQKTETWEGGVRTPFIIRAPGLVPAGRVCNGMIGDIDILPTLAAFAGVEVPHDRIIDGLNMKPLMTGAVTESPRKTRYFYYDSHLQAVRYGKWKLILKRPACPPWLHDQGLGKNFRGRDVEAVEVPQLYNLEEDLGETEDLAEQYPEVVGRLLTIAAAARADVGDYNQVGAGARFYDATKPQRPDAEKWEDE